jgi:thioredoxin reductase
MDGGRRRVIHVRNWLLSGERTGCCVVWGADRDGVATADHLARTGTKILLISASHELAPDVGRRAKILTVPRLENDPGVRIVRNATLTEMDEHRVKVRTGQRERWIDAPGPLLLSRGLTPDTALLDVYRRHAPPRLGVFVAGAADGHGDSLRHSLASAASVVRALGAAADARGRSSGCR